MVCAGESVAKYIRQPSPYNTEIVALGVDTYLKMLLHDNFVVRARLHAHMAMVTNAVCLSSSHARALPPLAVSMTAPIIPLPFSVPACAQVMLCPSSKPAEMQGSVDQWLIRQEPCLSANICWVTTIAVCLGLHVMVFESCCAPSRGKRILTICPNSCWRAAHRPAPRQHPGARAAQGGPASGAAGKARR